MGLPRRALLAGAAAVPAAARAQPWPSRPIRLILPFSPGGAIDALARLLAERMSADLGQQVVVDPRPGANTIVGRKRPPAPPPTATASC